jgi:phospholipid transport system substrate-binding protein
MIRKTGVALAVLALTSLVWSNRFVLGESAAAPTGPMAQMKALADEIIQTVKEPVCKSDQQICREKLRALVESHWDVTEMARMALGVHWKELSNDQRHQFAKLFGDLTEAIYLSKANLSKAQDISNVKVDFLREIRDSDQYSQVNTNVTLEGRDKPVNVNYRLKLEGGDWKVYDVIVDGISIVSNYRNQFSRVINNKGYPELVRELQEKVHQVSAAQGT